MSIAEIVESVVAGPLPLRLVAYDGSALGPADAPRALHLRTPRAAAYLATAPGDLGLARAYVAGDLTVEGVHPGDPYDLLVDLAARHGIDRSMSWNVPWNLASRPVRGQPRNR